MFVWHVRMTMKAGYYSNARRRNCCLCSTYAELSFMNNRQRQWLKVKVQHFLQKVKLEQTKETHKTQTMCFWMRCYKRVPKWTAVPSDKEGFVTILSQGMFWKEENWELPEQKPISSTAQQLEFRNHIVVIIRQFDVVAADFSPSSYAQRHQPIVGSLLKRRTKPSKCLNKFLANFTSCCELFVPLPREECNVIWWWWQEITWASKIPWEQFWCNTNRAGWHSWTGVAKLGVNQGALSAKLPKQSVLRHF